MRSGRFGPVVTAMITPMRDDGAVNHSEAARLAIWLIDHGSTGLVIAGTTGEGPTVDDGEKLDLFRTVVKAVGSRAPIIANAGSNDTRRSVEFAKQAAACGVHALMAVGPYYNKPPQAGLIRHFTSFADATDLPVMIYNIPGRTSVNILPDTIVTLAEHPKIVAIKESSGDVSQLAEIAARAPKNFDCYSGDDPLALSHAVVGGCGVVSVASHVAGSELAAMFKAFGAGDTDRAATVHHSLMPLFRALFAVTSPIPVKAAMRALGFSVGECRLPLIALTADQERTLQTAIRPWLPASTAVSAR
ncbi:MAG: 4-hydroxy-tetrahydrodipicolinate synthase [Candidatus Eremiobacteraeota bacterium]|nr:4-hydroxy-tetrahydrodipicolinate synthase [Candidatus Eremiobacteraeota bacterium]